MQGHVAHLGHAIAIVRILAKGPLKEILLLVKRLGDEIGELVRHIGTTIYRGAGARDRVNWCLQAAQQAHGNVVPLEVERQRELRQKIFRELKINEVLALAFFIPNVELWRVRKISLPDDHL